MYFSEDNAIKYAEILLKLVYILQDIAKARSENNDSVEEYNDSVVVENEDT